MLSHQEYIYIFCFSAWQPLRIPWKYYFRRVDWPRGWMAGCLQYFSQRVSFRVSNYPYHFSLNFFANSYNTCGFRQPLFWSAMLSISGTPPQVSPQETALPQDWSKDLLMHTYSNTKFICVCTCPFSNLRLNLNTILYPCLCFGLCMWCARISFD